MSTRSVRQNKMAKRSFRNAHGEDAGESMPKSHQHCTETGLSFILTERENSLPSKSSNVNDSMRIERS